MHVKERWHRSEKSGTMNSYVMKEEIIFWRMELLFVRSDVKWLFRGCKSDKMLKDGGELRVSGKNRII